MMRFLFYDINLLNHKKYIGDIIQAISSDHNNQVFLVYDEFDAEGESFFNELNCSVIKNGSVSYRRISNLLQRVNPDILVVNAQRLSDSGFVSVAKQQGIPTAMIQHGMYIPFMKRERYFFLKKIYKTYRYLLYSQVIAKVVKRSGLEVFRKFYSVFVKGSLYRDRIDFLDAVNVQNVLTYSDYWSKYHFDIFGYSLDNQHVIGYHELKRVNSILEEDKEKDAICYIAQTLVEDGRIDKKNLVNFLDTLSNVKDRKIYIKLHPRSNIDLYKYPNFTFLREDFPNVGTYVGHYSSMIALAACVGQHVILYEFEGHEIPSYFKEIGETCYTLPHFETLLQKELEVFVKKSDINYYFSKDYDVDNVVHLLKQIAVKGKK